MEAACAPSSHLELVLLLLPVEVLKQNQAGLHGGLTDAKGHSCVGGTELQVPREWKDLQVLVFLLHCSFFAG